MPTNKKAKDAARALAAHSGLPYADARRREQGTHTESAAELRALAQQKYDQWYRANPVPGEEDSLSHEYVRNIVPELLATVDRLSAEPVTVSRSGDTQLNTLIEMLRSEDLAQRIQEDIELGDDGYGILSVIREHAHEEHGIVIPPVVYTDEQLGLTRPTYPDGGFVFEHPILKMYLRDGGDQLWTTGVINMLRSVIHSMDYVKFREHRLFRTDRVWFGELRFESSDREAATVVPISATLADHRLHFGSDPVLAELLTMKLQSSFPATEQTPVAPTFDPGRAQARRAGQGRAPQRRGGSKSQRGR